MCQCRACTGLMLSVSGQYRPITGTYRHVNRGIAWTQVHPFHFINTELIPPTHHTSGNISKHHKTCSIASKCVAFCHQQQGHALLLVTKCQACRGNIAGFSGVSSVELSRRNQMIGVDPGTDFMKQDQGF